MCLLKEEAGQDPIDFNIENSDVRLFYHGSRLQATNKVSHAFCRYYAVSQALLHMAFLLLMRILLSVQGDTAMHLAIDGNLLGYVNLLAPKTDLDAISVKVGHHQIYIDGDADVMC